MDPQQQFCLKWNSFGNNLVSTFENLFKSASLTDVTLFCEGVTFQAHKLILAACSKHFQDLFESAPVCPSILVILDGTSSSNMSALLEFMYKGEVHVAQESLSSFLKSAEYLQVKGLSVEQEKLVTQTPSMNDVHLDVHHNSNRKHNKQFAPNICGIKIEDGGSANSRSLHVSDSEAMLPPSSNTSSSPYHYPYKGQFYEQRVAASNQHPTAYDVIPRKRHHRSPSDSNTMTRASVLRDGSKKERESPLSASCTPPIPSSGMGHHFEPASSSLSLPSIPNEASNTLYGTAAVEKSPSPQIWHSSGTNCAEDLRMKCASVESGGSSSLDENGCDNRKFYSTTTVESSGDNLDRISQHSHMDLKVSSPSTNTSAPTWNSTICATPHKITTTTTPDGKKLQCPFCERLYGYETNLRAHIRQRHQGIRVPCPFCTRTFTRNNTVRRHIAREHKTELSLKALQQSQVQNHSQQPQ